jgi:hypothetical protein
VILLTLPACSLPFLSHDAGERQAATELTAAVENSGLPREATVSIERERYRWNAEDWTAGRVAQVGPDFVVVDSVTPGVGLVKLGLPDDAPVFEGNAPVPATRLAPGTPVRANFIDKHAAEPLLVSLELLSPAQLTHLAVR